MPTILIADEHAILRRGVKEILGSELEDAVCIEAENGPDALAQVDRQAWDLLILDPSVLGCNGLQALKDLHRQRASLRILVFGIYSEDHYAKPTLMAGARGYLSKGATPFELMKAVRRVLAGGRYVSDELADQLANELDESMSPLLLRHSLSSREFEILRLIASGKTVGEIAESLHLAVTTVSTYRARTLEKLHKVTTADLVRYAIENHLE